VVENLAAIGPSIHDKEKGFESDTSMTKITRLSADVSAGTEGKLICALSACILILR